MASVTKKARQDQPRGEISMHAVTAAVETEANLEVSRSAPGLLQLSSIFTLACVFRLSSAQPGRSGHSASPGPVVCLSSHLGEPGPGGCYMHCAHRCTLGHCAGSFSYVNRSDAVP